MKYQIKNVTMNIDCTDGEFAGDCNFYIPFAHKEFLKDGCGVQKNIRFKNDGYEHIFEHNYGEIYLNKDLNCYYSSSPDLLISYLGWLFEQNSPQSIDVEYSNAFWAIHDAQHAIFDESGCSIYVDEYVEKERLEEAFKLMIEAGFEVSYELIQEVDEAYNNRFNRSVSFQDYLIDNQLLEYEEYSE